MNDNTKKIVVAGMDQKDLSLLADRIADDLHLTAADSAYEIGQAILEYQDEIDKLPDYNAVLEFIRELWDTFDLWLGE
jgi:hypothetical protein